MWSQAYLHLDFQIGASDHVVIIINLVCIFCIPSLHKHFVLVLLHLEYIILPHQSLSDPRVQEIGVSEK